MGNPQNPKPPKIIWLCSWFIPIPQFVSLLWLLPWIISSWCLDLFWSLQEIETIRLSSCYTNKKIRFVNELRCIILYCVSDASVCCLECIKLFNFIHSGFIHSGYFYSVSSSPLLLRARILCRNYTPKRHRQLWVKDLLWVPMWRLERESNPWPFGRKTLTLPMRHTCPTSWWRFVLWTSDGSQMINKFNSLTIVNNFLFTCLSRWEHLFFCWN